MNKRKIIDKWMAALNGNLYDELINLINEKPFDAIPFPTLRKVAATTLGQQILNVQPMSAPTGITNYIEYVHRKNLYDEIIKLTNEL